jgi:hypothetical protein
MIRVVYCEESFRWRMAVLGTSVQRYEIFSEEHSVTGPMELSFLFCRGV